MPSFLTRSATVARVNEAFAKWPRLPAMPVGGERSSETSKLTSGRIDNSKGDAAYVSALYELAHLGAKPIGRTEAGDELIGEIPE